MSGPHRTLVTLLGWLMLLSASTRGADFLTLNRADLATLHARAQARDPEVAPAVKSLLKKADSSLAAPLVAVVQKKKPAPGGSAHDYVSLSKYFWPDPARPDGLPYILRDGQVNPEVAQYDADCKAVDYLVPFLTGSQPWPHQQIHKPSAAMGKHLLLAASRGLADPRYAKAWNSTHPQSSGEDLFLPPDSNPRRENENP